MTTATILSIVFNFLTHGDHTYKAISTIDIGGHSELWVKDGKNHDTYAVVVIMTEYIVGHILKAITYHHLLLKICTCGTIQGCATIKINHENKVICTRIVMHWATIWICPTNRVNMVCILCSNMLSKCFNMRHTMDKRLYGIWNIHLFLFIFMVHITSDNLQ